MSRRPIFNSAEGMAHKLTRDVALHNHQFPQSALKSKTPMQAMKDWYAPHPHLSGKRPYDHSGYDTNRVPIDFSASTP
jgi:hypothetical protein